MLARAKAVVATLFGGDRGETLLSITEALVGRRHTLTAEKGVSSLHVDLLEPFGLLMKIFKFDHDLADVRFLGHFEFTNTRIK